MKKCLDCQARIRPGDHFCPKCGNEVHASKQKPISHPEENSFHPREISINRSKIPLIIAVITSIAAAGFAASWAIQGMSQQSGGDAVPSITVNSPFKEINSSISASSDIYQVASYFQCGCGECNDDELTSCNCPTAIQEREYIQNQLDRGKSVDDVRLLVFQTYGSIKPAHQDWAEEQLKKAIEMISSQ